MTSTKLPLVHEWKQRNHKHNQSCADKHSIKFSIISQESMPYLQCGNSGGGLFRGFRKNENSNSYSNDKQNYSFNLLNNSRSQGYLSSYSRDDEIELERKLLKLKKLRNRAAYEKTKLKLEYQHLKINSIIECATQQLYEKQNRMLNGMI